MKRDDVNITHIFIRYLILVILGLLFPLLYAVFLPLTLYPVYFILSLFYSVKLFANNTLFVEGTFITLISACIAASAYYLLLILNFSTPINIKKRAKSIAFLIVSFLVLNVIRIVAFSVLAVNSFSYFDIAHKAVWYIGATLLVVILWFVNIYLFNINNTPVYSDILQIYRLAKGKRKISNKR